jgi:glutamine synthetase
MRDSDLVKDTMGEHAFEVFYNAKIKEWRRFSSEVHDWEIKNYLKNY